MGVVALPKSNTAASIPSLPALFALQSDGVDGNTTAEQIAIMYT